MAGPPTRPPGSGRKKGQTNRITEEVRKLAKIHAPDAIKELARLGLEAKDERARVEANKVILDRAYGRISPLGEPGVNNTALVKIVITGDDAKL